MLFISSNAITICSCATSLQTSGKLCSGAHDVLANRIRKKNIIGYCYSIARWQFSRNPDLLGLSVGSAGAGVGVTSNIFLCGLVRFSFLCPISSNISIMRTLKYLVFSVIDFQHNIILAHVLKTQSSGIRFKSITHQCMDPSIS